MSILEDDFRISRERNAKRLRGPVDELAIKRRHIRKYEGQVAYRCEICDTKVQGKALQLDHCHVSGEVRGWLCAQCNMGLGMFKDSEALLRHALAYLGKHAHLKRRAV